MTTKFPWQPTAKTAIADTACVNFGGDLHLYATGFREGAEALLEIVRARGHDQDVLIYPIVYSLRHSIELLLKQVMRAGRTLVDEPGDFPDTHRLDRLWNTCKPVLQQVWPNDPAYSVVESTIERLVEVDPEGEAFRYPLTRKTHGGRKATLNPDLRHLDLGALVADVVRTIDLLDGADTGLDVYLDSKQDMLLEQREVAAEMRAEIEAEMRAEFSEEMRGE